MGKTFAEKVLSRYAGSDVSAGTIVTVKPDHVLSHDNSAAIHGKFTSMGAERVHNPKQPVIVLDHIVPAASEKAAQNHKTAREFARQQKLPHFFDVGRGVCHQVFIVGGFARPGRLIVGSDSHTTSYGALGAFSAGIGRSEAAGIWATGEIWLKVPESMRVILSGTPKSHVTAKDIMLYIAGEIGSDGALYRSIEFSGDYIESAPLADRIVFSNMAVELGAKNGYVRPDETVYSFLEGRNVARGDYTAVFPDEDAEYVQTVEIDVSTVPHMVARPHTVDNVTPAADVDVSVDQVLIGTCTNGRIEDLRQAAEILRGTSVNSSTRLLILPASSTVYKAAAKEGLMEVFIDAGAIVLNPGCGPCLGAHEGVMAPGEVTVSTANRNFKGRMGCRDAEIYLASPAVAAATAVTGMISVPKGVSNE